MARPPRARARRATKAKLRTPEFATVTVSLPRPPTAAEREMPDAQERRDLAHAMVERGLVTDLHTGILILKDPRAWPVKLAEPKTNEG